MSWPPPAPFLACNCPTQHSFRINPIMLTHSTTMAFSYFNLKCFKWSTIILCVYPISPFQFHCTLVFQKERVNANSKIFPKIAHGWHWHFLRQRREAEAVVIVLRLLSLFVVVETFWKYVFNIKMETLGRQFDRGFGQLKKKVAMEILTWESFYEITYKWILTV